MGVIIPNSNAMFVHVPKCAGTSITKALSYSPNQALLKKNKHIKKSTYLKRNKNTRIDFAFCCVRNPWDRIVSGYFYYKRKRSPIVNNKSFAEFLDDVGKTMIIEQVEWADECDHVMMYESLSKDFEVIRKKLDAPAKCSLGRANASSHENYKTYYEKDWMIEKVAELYPNDIKTWNYDFT